MTNQPQSDFAREFHRIMKQAGFTFEELAKKVEVKASPNSIKMLSSHPQNFDKAFYAVCRVWLREGISFDDLMNLSKLRLEQAGRSVDEEHIKAALNGDTQIQNLRAVNHRTPPGKIGAQQFSELYKNLLEKAGFTDASLAKAMGKGIASIMLIPERPDLYNGLFTDVCAKLLESRMVSQNEIDELVAARKFEAKSKPVSMGVPW